jgi:hypothetical protein
MPASEYRLLKDKPRLDPGSQRQFEEWESTQPEIAKQPAGGPAAGGTSGTGAGAGAPLPGGATPPAPGGTPPAPNPPAPGGAASTPPQEEAVPAPAINVSDELKRKAVEKARQLYDAEASATNAYPDVTKDAVEGASQAQNQRQPLLSLANDLAAQPRGANALTPGKVQEIAQPVMAVANNLATMFGVRAPAFEGDLSNTESIKKNIKLLAKEAQGNAIAHAAFVDMEQAIPTNLNSPDAQAKMIADILAINQRVIDRGKFHGMLREAAAGPDGMFIGKAPHAASALDPDAQFNLVRSPAAYNAEKTALIKAFKEGPPGMENAAGRPMSWYEFIHEHGSKLTQKQKNDVAKRLGSPNIMRYFGLGE